MNSDFLTLLALTPELRHHVVEWPLVREVVRRQLVDLCEPAGKVSIEEERRSVNLHLEQVRADDRDDAPVVEIGQKLLPDYIAPESGGHLGTYRIQGHGACP